MFVGQLKYRLKLNGMSDFLFSSLIITHEMLVFVLLYKIFSNIH